MATGSDFIQFVADQVSGAGNNIRYKKMFGEYMLYADERPVLLVCDDTVYVKQIPETMAIFAAHGITPDAGTPYDGARPHWGRESEQIDWAPDLFRSLARVGPLPKPKMPTTTT